MWMFATEPQASFSIPAPNMAAWDFANGADWFDFVELGFGRAIHEWDFDDLGVARRVAARMTREQMLLWAVWNVDGQICNGGISQMLFNSYGQLAEEGVEGLEMFGLTAHARILDEALTLFGSRPVSRDRDDRIARLEEIAQIEEQVPPSTTDEFLEAASAIFTGCAARWDALESAYFALHHAKSHGPGYNAPFFRPLAEWIIAHPRRFFVP